MRKLIAPVVALLGAVLGWTAATASPAATFSRSPAAGPPGTSIHVASITRCPVNGGKSGPPVVQVDLLQGSNRINSAELPLGASGRWQATLLVPHSATPGRATLQVTCFSQPPSSPPPGISFKKTLAYDNQNFTITSLPSLPPAAPARPVTGVPTFTG